MTYLNLPDMHRKQAEHYGPKTAIRHKRLGLYRDVSWTQYWEHSAACAAALVEHGIQPGDRVGMISENRLEWLFADMGLMAAGGVNVPAHGTLSGKQICDQFAHAEVSWVFVSSREQFEKVWDIRKTITAVKGIVTFDDVGDKAAITWAAFVLRGRQAANKTALEVVKRIDQLKGSDLATIMYTSGTTGNSKGVMLTHGNLLTNAVSMHESTAINQDSIVLSWLPYSHIYGRLVDHYIHLAAGSTLCLAESQETLIDDLKEIQPTNFSGVPRFYEKVLAAIATDDPERTKKRLRDVFGPRIRWLNSGGAPLPVPIAQAYRDAGLTMLQGYGLTETSPVITFSTVENNKIGTSGRPVPKVEVKIAPDGEILARGPNIMKGYWKNPEATAEAINSDGWFHTGDLGELSADGYLTITGRKKDLLVMSNGKKVVPTHLEGLLINDSLIDQAVVHGEGKNYLTALIVPKFDNLRDAVKAEGISETDNAKLVQNPAVRNLIAQRIDAGLADLAGWEQIKKFILLPKPFTQEAEEMTVSLKLRRGVILKKYQEQLEALYKA